MSNMVGFKLLECFDYFFSEFLKPVAQIADDQCCSNALVLVDIGETVVTLEELLRLLVVDTSAPTVSAAR
ncbi:hypothetical protein [Rhizobium sp. 007]|uniref:hypothetical protein n=1 Tax=Rhizobium sp. 007 TaxID=2785056 RepID=UPI00188DDE94|nr:hypothetical protein [Rhizobium sp. 007]QPB24437.1 hypothetical protein ISN39_33300 [Rhizobium sp. 007]